ncbi:MAG: HlyD family secretion protein [Alistipes sp.]|nr:HlyD family secretion protein [Alistipes sp.]
MKHRTKKRIYNVFAVALLVVAIVWVCAKFVHLGNVEFTENAHIEQHIVPVDARIQGFVKEVRFGEYERVEKGDTLLIIEDAEFRFLLAQAEANYANATTDKSAMHNVISTTRTNIAVTEATIEEARIRLENAERNYLRYKSLLADDAVTRQQYDNMATEWEAAKARYEVLVKQRESVEAVSREQNTRLGQNDAGIAVAEAALDLARLNLSYTVVLAPCSGTTGRKDIHEGQLVHPGQRIVDIVDESEKWVVANYKETQIENIRPGAEVEIEVDAVPNVVFKGVVRSLSQATGGSMSMLPQDNSSGNFIKIEQRIPVLIDFTDDNDPEALARAGVGMNVECTVKY